MVKMYFQRAYIYMLHIFCACVCVWVFWPRDALSVSPILARCSCRCVVVGCSHIQRELSGKSLFTRRRVFVRSTTSAGKLTAYEYILHLLW